MERIGSPRQSAVRSIRFRRGIEALRFTEGYSSEFYRPFWNVLKLPGARECSAIRESCPPATKAQTRTTITITDNGGTYNSSEDTENLEQQCSIEVFFVSYPSAFYTLCGAPAPPPPPPPALPPPSAPALALVPPLRNGSGGGRTGGMVP